MAQPPKSIEVRPGQVWADNDKRSAGRFIKVIRLCPAILTGETPRAVCVPSTPEGSVFPGAVTKIKLSRFRPTATGYRLVKEAAC